MLRKALALLVLSVLIVMAGPQDAASSTLQEMIDNAYWGEVVSVGHGPFFGPGNVNVDFHGKAVTLQASNPANPPTILCEYGENGFIFRSGEGSGSKVIGFDIRDAHVRDNLPGPDTYNDDGGGVLIINSSPVIQDCLFNNCVAKFGGGIAVIGNSSPQIINCTFNDCYASYAGAAAYVFSSGTATFSKNIIANSVMGSGVHSSSVSAIDFSCCSFWNNAQGHLSGTYSLDANTIFQDPQFCGEPTLDFTIAEISPCAPANSPCGELIGAKPVGCLGYVPGDANDDELVNMLDITYLINYKYKGGPAPIPLDAGDVNNDCTINILDITYLINFLYKGGPAPLPGCASQGAPAGKIGQQVTTVNLTTRYDSDHDKTAIGIESPIDLYALELETSSESEITATNLVESMQLFAGHSDGVTRIGVFDMKGKGYIAAGNTAIIELAGCVESISAFGVDATGGSVVIATKSDGDVVLPHKFALFRNYPNPFNPVTTISYDLPVATNVKLVVYNVTGQRVATLVNGYKTAGSYHVEWDSHNESGQTVASGVYLYRLTAGEFVETKKMVLLK